MHGLRAIMRFRMAFPGTYPVKKNIRFLKKKEAENNLRRGVAFFYGVEYNNGII